MTLTLDTDNFCAVISDGNQEKRVELTKKEWDLLNYLIDHSDRVCSKKELVEMVWEDKDILLNTVEVYVKYIRNKIGNGFIYTRRGFGYKFNPEGK